MEKETEDGRWKKKDGVIGEEIGRERGCRVEKRESSSIEAW